jgi:hypothetical protein
VLPAGAAEDLVVRGQQLRLAERRDPELDAGTAHVLADHPLLHDPLALTEFGQEGLDVDQVGFKLHLADPVGEPLEFRGAARLWKRPQVHDGIPRAGDSLVELHHRRLRVGVLAPQVGKGLDDLLLRPEVLRPDGKRTPASRNTRRQPVLVPSEKCRGSAAYIGIPSEMARSRSRVVVL